jgi:hypothetical protein
VTYQKPFVYQGAFWARSKQELVSEEVPFTWSFALPDLTPPCGCGWENAYGIIDISRVRNRTTSASTLRRFIIEILDYIKKKD